MDKIIVCRMIREPLPHLMRRRLDNILLNVFQLCIHAFNVITMLLEEAETDMMEGLTLVLEVGGRSGKFYVRVLVRILREAPKTP
eukprot:scaffold11568_cov116-Skeletonema_dohrnii-CCMP3373.AAC.3